MTPLLPGDAVAHRGYGDIGILLAFTDRAVTSRNRAARTASVAWSDGATGIVAVEHLVPARLFAVATGEKEYGGVNRGAAGTV